MIAPFNALQQQFCMRERDWTPNSVEALKRLGYQLRDIIDIRNNEESKHAVPKDMRNFRQLFIKKRNEYMEEKRQQRFTAFLKERDQVIRQRFSNNQMEQFEQRSFSSEFLQEKNNLGITSIVKKSNRTNNNVKTDTLRSDQDSGIQEQNKRNYFLHKDDSQILEEERLNHEKSESRIKSVENLILKRLLEEEVHHNREIRQRAEDYKNERIMNLRKQKFQRIYTMKAKQSDIKKEKELEKLEEYQKLNRFNIRKMQNRSLKNSRNKLVNLLQEKEQRNVNTAQIEYPQEEGTTLIQPIPNIPKHVNNMKIKTKKTKQQREKGETQILPPVQCEDAIVNKYKKQRVCHNSNSSNLLSTKYSHLTFKKILPQFDNQDFKIKGYLVQFTKDLKAYLQSKTDMHLNQLDSNKVLEYDLSEIEELLKQTGPNYFSQQQQKPIILKRNQSYKQNYYLSY